MASLKETGSPVDVTRGTPGPSPRWSKVSDLLSVSAGVLTIISIGFAISLYQSGSQKTAILNPSVKELEELHSSMTSLNKDIATVKEQIQSLANVPEEAKVAIQLKGIGTAVNDLQMRHSRLEEAILSNPAKAIEVPILRKDLDNLKEAQQQNLLALKQGVDQVYDLNKWLLGAMALSIITLAISNFLKGKEKD